MTICSWCQGKAAHHGGWVVWGRAVHFMETRKQRTKKEPGYHRFPQAHIPVGRRPLTRGLILNLYRVSLSPVGDQVFNSPSLKDV